MLVRKKPLIAAHPETNPPLAERERACATCGSEFTPRFVFSKICDFCKTPYSGFLMVPSRDWLTRAA